MTWVVYLRNERKERGYVYVRSARRANCFEQPCLEQRYDGPAMVARFAGMAALGTGLAALPTKATSEGIPHGRARAEVVVRDGGRARGHQTHRGARRILIAVPVHHL